MDCSMPGSPVHHQFPELAQTHVHQVSDASNHLILYRPLLLLPLVVPSIRVFSTESVLHIRWPKFWHFNFSISPSNEYTGQISFRMDWLELLEVQGSLKSFLQNHSSKASILDVFHSNFELVHCSMSSSNCCFLSCIQVPQESGNAFWYSHLINNIQVCCDPHSQSLWHSQWSRSSLFLLLLLFFESFAFCMIQRQRT